MESLKQSAYNYFVALSPTRTIAYNFLYRTMLVFDNAEYLQVKSHLEAVQRDATFQSTDPVFASLLRYRFLIDQPFDELAYFKFAYYRSVFDNSTLVTIVLPTLDCNFKCPYCFEFKKHITISQPIIDAYLRWVESKLQDKKHFHITWFGGEPLLALKQMQRITDQALALCDRFGCGYSSSITTNGYLLTADTIRKLDSMRVANVHVTLDGPAATHDYYRQTRGGRPTFDRILTNIETWCETSTSHLPLGIRVNVTDDNVNIIPDLFTRFSESAKRRTRIYFRYVWSNEASNFHVFSTGSSSAEAFERLAKLYEEASRAGFHIDNPIDEIAFNYCEVDFANHFAMDPRGFIYLCGHTYDPREAIGHVAHDLTDVELSEYCRWINTNPFDDQVCRSCRMLPLCKGGCRKSRFAGHRPCIEEKDYPDLYVRNLYAKYTRMQEATASNEHAPVDNELVSSELLRE